MQENKEIIWMGTGHRPQDTPAGFEKCHPWKLGKLKLLENYLKNNRPDAIISGMALGWDTYLAWVAIRTEIPFLAYVPFEGQEKRWSKEHQEQFHWLLGRAKEVKYVCDPGYANWKMHRRNEAMIKDSEMVLALWNPDKKFGGTWSTVAHATTLNKKILNFWGDTISEVKLNSV